MLTSSPPFQQIGAEIGRGAFAVVYQAFNVETGDFVAVKRFPLTAIDDDSLGSIQVSHAKSSFHDSKYSQSWISEVTAYTILLLY